MATVNIDDFVGNDETKNQIKLAFASGKTPHAIILEGEKGTGKKTFANIIAKSAVCSGEGERPCLECEACIKVAKGIHPDVIFPEKSGALQAVNVATVREIKKDAYVVPNEATNKIYIFTDADSMVAQAQNALLKVLEEPPKNVIFILTCANLGSILPTVRSRAWVFKLSPVSIEVAIEYILKSHKEYSEEDTRQAVLLAEGNIGRALEILSDDQIKGLTVLSEGVIRALGNADEFEIMTSLGKASEDKKELEAVLEMIYSKLKKSLVLGLGDKSETDLKFDSSAELAKKMESKNIFKILNVVEDALRLHGQNVNKELIIAYMSAEIHKIINRF